MFKIGQVKFPFVATALMPQLEAGFDVKFGVGDSPMVDTRQMRASLCVSSAHSGESQILYFVAGRAEREELR